MQRNGQHGARLASPFFNFRNDTRSRQRNPAFRKRQPIPVRNDFNGRSYIVVVVQRFAHSHENNIGNLALGVGQAAKINIKLLCPTWRATFSSGPIVNPIAGQQQLPNNFTGLKIAHQGLRSGMAKRAIQGAADLRGNAKRAAICFRNINRLNFRWLDLRTPPWQPQQPFARAISRNLFADNLWSIQRKSRRQLRAQFLGNIAHVVKRDRAMNIDPAPELVYAHPQFIFWHAEHAQSIAQPCATKARK